MKMLEARGETLVERRLNSVEKEKRNPEDPLSLLVMKEQYEYPDR